MKKLIALLLALVMVFALVACGNPGTEQPSGNPDPKPSESTPAAPSTEGPKTDSKGRYPAETLKIGFVNYDTTAEQWLVLETYFDYLSEQFNIEVMCSESLNSAEGEMAFIDACAAAGCKAIFGYYNVANEQSMLRAAEHGMYYFGQGANKAFIENPEIMANPYYLGSWYAGDADYQYGWSCIEMLVNAGCKKIAGVSGGKNFGVQMFIDRWQGAMDAIAHFQAQDPEIELVYEVAGFPGTDGGFEAGQTAVLGMDNVDGVYSTLSALMWITPTQGAGKFGQLKFAAAGETMSEGAIGMFGAGFYVGTATEIIDVFGMGIPLMINAVEGTPIRDENGNAPLIKSGYWKVSNVEEAGYYGSVQGGDNGWAFDHDDVRNLLVAYNPDVTIADYEALYTAVTAAEIQARHAD